MFKDEVPTSAVQITDRLNGITFNSSLLAEMRAIAFVVKLLEDGWLKEEYRSHYKHVLVHSIEADRALSGLSASSKFNTDWKFLTHLRDLGRETAAEWLDEHYADIGKRATVDLAKTCSTKTAGIHEHLD